MVITGINKKAFQQDAYRPLRWISLDVSTDGEVYQVYPSPGTATPWLYLSHSCGIPTPPPPVYPQKGPGIRHTHPLPPDRMTDTCENIIFPQLLWRAVNIIKDRWIHYRLGWHFQSTLLAKDIDPRYSFPFCQWSLLVEISHNMSWIILLSNSINSFIREAPYCLNHKECRVNTRTGRGWDT